MKNQAPFWMVYGENQGPPSVMHGDRDTAEREAKRLAGIRPGVKFYVLQAVGIAEKIDVQFTRLEAPDEIPF